MSTLGSLSYRYDLTSTLGEELLRALIALKIKFYQLPGHEMISKEALKEARQSLAGGINGVILEMDPQKARRGQPAHEFWPSIIRRLAKTHKTSLINYVAQLQVTQDNLLTSLQVLTEEDVRRLEEISDAVSDDLAVLERRLVRR